MKKYVVIWHHANGGVYVQSVQNTLKDARQNAKDGSNLTNLLPFIREEDEELGYHIWSQREDPNEGWYSIHLVPYGV